MMSIGATRHRIWIGNTPLSLAGVLFLSACALAPSPRPAAQPEPDVGRRTSPIPRRPGETDMPTISPRNVADSPGTVSQVCRNRAIPSGYVAIDFVQDDARCPRSKQSADPYTATLVMRLDGSPVGTALEVCSDQRTPTDWARESAIYGEGRCPRANERGDAEPTMVRIRRLR